MDGRTVRGSRLCDLDPGRSGDRFRLGPEPALAPTMGRDHDRPVRHSTGNPLPDLTILRQLCVAVLFDSYRACVH